MNRITVLFLVTVALAITAAGRLAPAWAWGNEGHEIVAIIAADNLSPAARAQVAKILGTTDDVPGLETAMATAAVRPDTEFREEDRSTAPWHFIDICLQDSRRDLPARCPDGACVTAKIDEYARRLKESDCDRWGSRGDLAFLMHFVGDVHQPLHAATDADRGGNCITAKAHPPVRNLHAAWDTGVIKQLATNLHTDTPLLTAHQLNQLYANQKAADTWQPGAADDIAWEANQLARSAIYGALNIALEPCQPEVASCAQAPAGPIVLDRTYMDKAATIAGQQLAKAGFRLASLLNGMWQGGSVTHCALTGP